MEKNNKNEFYIKRLEDHLSVNRNKNPFVVNKDNVSEKTLEHFIKQYQLFPKNIISVLVAGIYNLSYGGYKNITKELIDNINEELGVYGKDSRLRIPSPHYSVLRKGVSEGIGIDVNYVESNEYTRNFINSLKLSVEENNFPKVLGAIYALEASAVPELNIVKELVKKLFKDGKKKIPRYLLDFFNFHISEIEINHKDRFFKLCVNDLETQKDWDGFEKGFDSVMYVMDIWWSEMFVDLKDKK